MCCIRMATASGSSGWADVAQLVEHSLGKGEVTSSILVIGSMEVKWEGSGRARLSRAAECHQNKAALAAEASRKGGSNSVVESQPSKLLVAGSIPVSRSSFLV